MTEAQVETSAHNKPVAVQAILDEAKTGLPALWLKDDIKKDQDGIRKSLVKVDASIHANAVQCLMQAHKHGDTSLMRRLLIDIVDTKTGYRRQGLIGWMRAYSPMELKADNINLSGTDSKGNRRPWDIEMANKTEFWTAKRFDEKLAKPIYKETVMSGIQREAKRFKDADKNTKDGQPIDPLKPFYAGKNIDAMRSFYDELDNKIVDLSAWKDDTKTVDEAKATIAKATIEAETAKTSLAAAVG